MFSRAETWLSCLLLENRAQGSSPGLCQGVQGRAGRVEVCVLQEALGTAFGCEAAHLSVSIRSVWGRRGKDGDSTAGGKNAGWPGFTGARRSVRLSPRRGRAVCFEQWSRLKDVLGMHKRYTVLTSSGMCSALGGRVLIQTPRYCCAL